jgi:hypothetical protein
MGATESRFNPMVSQYRGEGKTYPKISKPTPIYANGIVIGRVVGDTFRKTIIGSKHLLRTPKAICFDRSTLRDAAAAGATCVEIFDSETRTIYKATLDTIHRCSFPVRRGHGDQVGVTLDNWSINGAVPVAEQRIAQSNQERIDLQLSLFGEAGR